MARSNANVFEVKVLAERGVLFEGPVDTLFAQGVREPLAILAWHTPLIAKLAAGEISMKLGKTRKVIATVESGLLYIGDNEVTILADL